MAQRSHMRIVYGKTEKLSRERRRFSAFTIRHEKLMSQSAINPAIEMRHLRLMVAISSQGSLTSAATSLQLTQPALSHQLLELESQLKTPLFVRTARRTVSTPAGAPIHLVPRGLLSA